MKVISLRDLMLCEELSHVKNEITLIHPDNDKLVRSILTKIGFHEQHDFFYIASKHRDLQGKVAIGFQVVGEHSRDRKYNKFLDAHELCIVSGMSDATLGKELINLMGKSIRYPKPKGAPSEPNAKKQAKYEMQYDEEEDFPDNYSDGDFIEDDYIDNMKAIAQLEELRDIIRGTKGENN